MKDIDFIACGYPSIDRIIKLDSNPCICKTSTIMNDDNSVPYYGGCNVNIAYVGSKFGLNASLMMKVGRDFASSGYKGFLENGGVDLSGIEIVNEANTSSSYLVINPSGEHVTMFYPGAMDTKYKGSLNEDAVKRAKFGVITVGNPEYNIEFANLCKKNNVPLVFGMKCDFRAFTKEILNELMKSSEIVVMNEGEKAEIERIFNLESITELFKDSITKIIIVTKGSEGSEINYLENEEVKLISVPVAVPDRIVDTTGVGDAYLAGFLIGYVKGKNIEKCGRLGSVISSFVIEKMGCLTNIPNEADVLERYRVNYGEEF